MPLAPHAPPFLDPFAATGAPPLHDLSGARARQVTVTLFGTQGEPEPVGAVQDGTIPGAAGEMPARRYPPHGTGPFPLLCSAHGGGWVLGALGAYAATCRALPNAARGLVVARAYRLAPEPECPAAPEDRSAAAPWVAAHAGALGGTPRRLAVGGARAGSTPAAVVAPLARDRGGPALGSQ
jgi:acetyl esterase